MALSGIVVKTLHHCFLKGLLFWDCIFKLSANTCTPACTFSTELTTHPHSPEEKGWGRPTSQLSETLHISKLQNTWLVKWQVCNLQTNLQMTVKCEEMWICYSSSQLSSRLYNTFAQLQSLNSVQFINPQNIANQEHTDLQTEMPACGPLYM